MVQRAKRVRVSGGVGGLCGGFVETSQRQNRGLRELGRMGPISREKRTAKRTRNMWHANNGKRSGRFLRSTGKQSQTMERRQRTRSREGQWQITGQD